MLSKTTIEKLKSSLRGELIQQSDEHYEEARKLYNGMIDKRPLLIARCADVADVISAVWFGRQNDLLTAIRGGGHNGPGLGSCNGGLVIDLSLMKGVRVDPANRTVRGGPGCTQGDVDHAGHAFGLAVPWSRRSALGLTRYIRRVRMSLLPDRAMRRANHHATCPLSTGARYARVVPYGFRLFPFAASVPPFRRKKASISKRRTSTLEKVRSFRRERILLEQRHPP